MVALFGKAMESLADGAFLEEVSHLGVGRGPLRVHSLILLAVYSHFLCTEAI